MGDETEGPKEGASEDKPKPFKLDNHKVFRVFLPGDPCVDEPSPMPNENPKPGDPKSD